MEPQLLTRDTHLRRTVTDKGLAQGIAQAPVATTTIVALLAGALLGVLAAGSDGTQGGLGVALSLPGPWIAGAVLAAGLARSARRGALVGAAFLVSGMVAYYVGKQVLTGAVPGPLVAFWLGLAATTGLAGGAVVGTVGTQRWGPVALAATVAGWLLAEATVVPSAPWTELLLALMLAGLIAWAGRRSGPAPWLAGATVGGLAAVVVLSVLPDVLSRVL